MMKAVYSKIPGRLIKSFSVLVFLLCCFNVQQSKASHAAGADLTYEFLGNGQYRVTFTFYYDCSGLVSAPTTQSLTVSSNSCNFTDDYTMNPLPGTGQEITHACTGNPSTCAGGSVVGIQQWQYSTIVTLPSQCPDWQFNTSVGNRNAAVTTIENPDNFSLYVDAWLDNTNGDNNSPTFTNPPIAFECIGQTNNFNQGVIDADGDSLVYSFIAPRSDDNTPLPYKPGYSTANPLISSPAVNINPISGDITMNPQQQEIAVVTVLIEEYRNGNLIGTVMRDMQLYIVPCSNTLPTVSGINGGSNFLTSSCAGGQLCFDIISNDTDPGQVLTMTWNHGIPAATFTTTSGPSPIGHFCWSPAPTDARSQPYTFSVTVRDNACPSNGVQTYQYSITVSNMSISLTSTPSVACNGDHTGSAMATSSGNAPLTYAWTTPSLTILTTSTISNLGAGPYTLNLTDAIGCVGTEQFTITEPPAINITVTPTNAGCGGSTGSALANVSGGTPGYHYLWSPGGQTTANATNLTTNTYVVTVTDNHNCTSTASTHITSNTPITFNLVTTGATCLANDGTARVTHSGGTGSFSYKWTPDIPGDTTTANLTGLITGGYSVIATDLGTGCSQSLSGIVQNLSGITATITSHTDASCQSSEDGSASVAASGGQPPYAYLWPNGDTTTSTNHLEPGTYLARVEDYNGCLAYASVTIGFVNGAPSINLGPDTMPCLGLPYILDAGPGYASYLWNDGSSGQTIAPTTSGIYSVIVTNAAGCENSDLINVNFTQCFIHGNNWGKAPAHPILNYSVVLYPNPANNELNVTINKLRNTEVTVIMTDILGNNVYFNKSVSDYNYSKKVDLQSLPAGIYLVRVEFNNEINTTRVIKQ
jgi:hypothetical protein